MSSPWYFRCDCAPGWHGVHCTTKTSVCTTQSSSELCGHGVCASTPSSPLGYTCICEQVRISRHPRSILSRPNSPDSSKFATGNPSSRVGRPKEAVTRLAPRMWTSAPETIDPVPWTLGSPVATLLAPSSATPVLLDTPGMATIVRISTSVSSIMEVAALRLESPVSTQWYRNRLLESVFVFLFLMHLFRKL